MILDPAVGEPQLSRPAVARIEGQAGHVGDLAGTRRRRERHGVDAVLRAQPREEAAAGRGPGGAGGHVLGQGLAHDAGAALVERAGGDELAVEVPAAPVLLEHPLAERARALVGVLLGRDQLRDDLARARRPAEAHSGEERLGERAGLDDHVGGLRPQARRRRRVKAELPVRDILEDQEPVPPGQLNQRGPAVGRQGQAGRVLVVGNRVEHLGPQAALEHVGEHVDPHPVAVHRHAAQVRLVAAERHDRAEVGRRLDHRDVAGIHEALGRQLQAVDPAAGDHQLTRCRARALQRLEPPGQVVTQRLQPLRRGVLQRHRGVLRDQPPGDLSEHLAGKRLRVREAAGERDHVAGPGQGQDRGDLTAPQRPGAAGEARGPVTQLGRSGHRRPSDLLTQCLLDTRSGNRKNYWRLSIRLLGLPAHHTRFREPPRRDVCRLATTSAPLAHLAEVATPSTPRAELDELDLTLLRALAVDARQSQRALARAVGMSPPAIADRLARLERSGAIRGYRVEVDWAALGYPVVVYLAVTAGPGTDLSQIIREIRQLPEAQDMSVVTGGLDLLVRFRVRDHAHLRDLLLNTIFQIPGVQRTETFLSLADVEPANFTLAALDQMAERNRRDPATPPANQPTQLSLRLPARQPVYCQDHGDIPAYRDNSAKNK